MRAYKFKIKFNEANLQAGQGREGGERAQIDGAAGQGNMGTWQQQEQQQQERAVGGRAMSHESYQSVLLRATKREGSERQSQVDVLPLPLPLLPCSHLWLPGWKWFLSLLLLLLLLTHRQIIKWNASNSRKG